MPFDQLKRREFIMLLGGAAASWPLAASAQQEGRVRRIGVLLSFAADDPEALASVGAFLQGLQQLGWTDGRNVRIDYRWGANDAERGRRYAVELIALAPDVILVSGSPAVAASQQATHTVPVVFVSVVDPVGSGLVESLARPGGNTTGFTLFEFGISGKWLELLKEIAPRVTRAAVLRDPTLASGGGQLGAIQSVAPSFGVELSPIGVRDAGEIERAITAFARRSNGGLIVTGSALAVFHRELIIALAAQHRLPAIYSQRLRHRRRSDLLRGCYDRPVPVRGQLRRPHPQRREAGRPSGASADQIRVGDQPQDREPNTQHCSYHLYRNVPVPP